MPLPVTLPCILCFVLAVCRALSQNKLDSRIDSLQRTVEGLKSAFLVERETQQQNSSECSRKLDELKADVLAERIKQQQRNSEYSRKLRQEEERRKVLENEVADLRNMCNQKLKVSSLLFTQANGSSPDLVVVEAGGAAVRDLGPDRPARWTSVRTDGLLVAGRRHYWEVELSWTLGSDRRDSGWWLVGGIGARREGSDFSGALGNDDQSWTVRIRYHFGIQKWVYDCYHDNKSNSLSKRVALNNSEGTSRLGIHLNFADKNLTIFDANSNASVCSFPVVGGSEPLVPVIMFGKELFQRRFHLPAVNPSRPPEPSMISN